MQSKSKSDDDDDDDDKIAVTDLLFDAISAIQLMGCDTVVAYIFLQARPNPIQASVSLYRFLLHLF